MYEDQLTVLCIVIFSIQLHVDSRHVTRSSDSGYNTPYESGHFSGLKLLRFDKT